MVQFVVLPVVSGLLPAHIWRCLFLTHSNLKCGVQKHALDLSVVTGVVPGVVPGKYLPTSPYVRVSSDLFRVPLQFIIMQVPWKCYWALRLWRVWYVVPFINFNSFSPLHIKDVGSSWVLKSISSTWVKLRWIFSALLQTVLSSVNQWTCWNRNLRSKLGFIALQANLRGDGCILAPSNTCQNIWHLTCPYLFEGRLWTSRMWNIRTYPVGPNHIVETDKI